MKSSWYIPLNPSISPLRWVDWGIWHLDPHSRALRAQVLFCSSSLLSPGTGSRWRKRTKRTETETGASRCARVKFHGWCSHEKWQAFSLEINLNWTISQYMPCAKYIACLKFRFKFFGIATPQKENKQTKSHHTFIPHEYIYIGYLARYDYMFTYQSTSICIYIYI